MRSDAGSSFPNRELSKTICEINKDGSELIATTCQLLLMIYKLFIHSLNFVADARLR
jgi:hypothetical protein